MQVSLSKTESEYSVLKERSKSLATQLRDTETALAVSESALKAAEDKVETLKVVFGFCEVYILDRQKLILVNFGEA